MKKRFMAWLLTLAMLLTVFSPLSALADDFDPECQYPEDMPSTDDAVFSDPDVDPGVPSVVSAQDGTLSIAQIREKFPDGKYWNHAGNPGASNSVNNQDGWTDTPCPRHKTVGTSAQTCNGFAPSGKQLSWQCMGYAEKIGYDITGYNPRNNAHGWSTSKNVSALDSLKPGDIVRYKNDGHSIYVLGVDGNTVTYTDCNSDGHCKIRWDVTISKSTLASSFTYVRSAPFAISGGTNNLPNLCVDVVQGWQNHIYVKGWAFDPDSPNAKVAVHVYINNECHEVIADKYHDQGLDDTFHCGADHGFALDIPTDQTGEVNVSFYAIDEQDANQHSEPSDSYSSYKNPTKVTITSDKTGPTITNAKVTNVDSTGYTVTCTVTDASGVNRVQFPTWTEKNGQDDLLSGWEVSPKASGTRNGNTFTFRVKTSDHNNESGVYHTHIYAYDNSYRGNCAGAVTLTATVPVPTVAVTGVRLDKTSLSFTGTGSCQILTATVSPSNATNNTLTWSSSNTSVATVFYGVVEAVGFGTATITAKSNNGKTASCTVTVNPIAVTSVSLNKTSLSFTGTGSSQTLTATVSPSNATNKTLTWSSSNTSVATVSNGVVKAVGFGTATITAKSNNGKTASCSVTVNPIQPTGIKATPETSTLYGLNGTVKLSANVMPSNATNKAVTWSSRNTSVATVSSDGTVKAVGYGTTVITATTVNGLTSNCTINVKKEEVTSLTIATKPTKTNYYVGDTLNTAGLTLKAAYNNGTTQTITGGFTCTPTALSTAGVQTVTVNYGGKTATFTVNVQDVTLSSIAIASTPTKASYFVGDTLDTTGLKLTATYNNGTTQTITSGFTCTPTALTSAGTQTVTVNYGGKTATFAVNVQDVTLSGIAIASNPTKTSYFVGDTLDTTGLKLTATYNNGTTQTITGGFTCTPTALSTAGVQTVTVNYGGKTATFTVSVELPVLPFVTLTFDPTDGVLDLADTPEKTVYPGEAYGRLPEPTADGMVFLGWYTESGKRITSLTTCDLTGDATVSARWALASAEGWSFDEATGTLTLDGSGAMKEYTSAAEAPWYSYRDSIAHLVVKSGVTSLSSYAFVGCQNLADITLPDTLQTIGTMTFYGCDNLNNVTIPASVRTIGSYAFADALNLSRITFAGDAPEFGTGVFTFRKLTAYYPVYASGWETVVDGRYDFGGSITWVRSSESLAAEESVLLSAAEPDDVLALDWTL